MPQLQIHPDFKLQNQSFSEVNSLLTFVKEKLPDHYLFLKSLFSESKSILVNTSGSTGKSKSIQIEKRAMLASAEATGQFFKLANKTKALHCLSSDYIAGKMMWVRGLHLGWHLDLVAPDATPLLSTTMNFDFAAMVPLQVQNSLHDLHRIKKLIIGGAPISYTLELALLNKPCLCYQTYGMTETVTHIAVKELNNTKENYYKCLPKIKISVDGRSCLMIEAPYISKYLIKTNDMVRLISDTEFEWLGRFDNVVNSGGVKLFPEQIETKLAPIISKPFIVGALPDEKLGQKLVLLVESKQKISNLENILLETDLLKYEIPKETYYLHSFVRTKNNKIKRNDTFSLIHIVLDGITTTN